MNLWNLLRYISIQHLRLRKGQALMVVAGICLGVAAIVSIGVVTRSILLSITDSFDRVTGKAQLQITGAQSGFPESLVEIVQKVPGVEYAVAVIEADGMLTSGRERSLMILGVDVLLDTRMREYDMAGESADIPDPLLFLARPDSIVITRTMADREGLTIGRKIDVQTVDGIRTFQIRGILNPAGPARAMGGNLAVMDIYAAQMVFGKEGKVDRIDVSLRPGEDLETVRRAVAAAMPKGYMVETPSGRSKQVAQMLAHFRDSLNTISYLAIFVGMYLIYNAVSISIVHRRREIGILRALGVTRKEIILLFLGETLVLAIIASALGVVCGLLLAHLLMDTFGGIISEVYVRTVTQMHMNWIYPAMGFAVGIIASLLAALFPARTGSRIAPVSAIRSVPYAEETFFTPRRLNRVGVICLLISLSVFALYNLAGDSPLAKYKSLLIGAQLMLAIGISLFTPAFLKSFVAVFNRFFSGAFGAPGKLAGLNLQKNLTRNAIAVSAVFFGIAVFVASSGFVYSVKESVSRWLDTIIRCDIVISSGHPGASANSKSIAVPVGMLSQIRQIPGVRSAVPWRKTFIDYQGRKVLLSASTLEMYPEKSRLGGQPLSGLTSANMPPEEDSVAVNETFAAIFKIRKGDILTLPAATGPVAFHVKKIMVDYTCDSGVIGMDIRTYQRHWRDQLCDAFFVNVAPDARIEKVREDIQNRLGFGRKLFVLSARDFKGVIKQGLDRMFLFNYTLNVITLVIACMGIIVALLASVMERTREIGVLRAIGMLRRQIYLVVVLESVLMGLAGGILGSMAGVAAGWINLEGFFVANWGSAKYYMPLESIAWAIILSAGLSALAGLIPARQAAGTNIVEALSYE